MEHGDELTVTRIENLPNDVVILILQRLSFHDVLSARAVCRNWLRLCAHRCMDPVWRGWLVQHAPRVVRPGEHIKQQRGGRQCPPGCTRPSHMVQLTPRIEPDIPLMAQVIGNALAQHLENASTNETYARRRLLIHIGAVRMHRDEYNRYKERRVDLEAYGAAFLDHNPAVKRLARYHDRR